MELSMQALYDGVADILEVDTNLVTRDYSLEGVWDSLAIVSTIALLDDLYDLEVQPERLAQCRSVGELESLIHSELAS
jgi:acyl carrier protein